MATIRLHPEAAVEYEQAAAWYAARSQQAAQSFVFTVEQTIREIRTSPERYARASKRDRSCRVGKFPYHVVYRIHGEVILVVAIAHAKRRPGYWKRRK